ncbi:BQ5605_C004g02848 [Microbotryum silenes-dioicae]|uniref:BQ5605_C004g02848 protein n=1 Tax=Microbotryum silenes-dioicae TaxID=796604 RepID=A0A2X0MDG6_9BASI|nr:BQ5605_C004g02848 [Microbotryum silenes-dioicae]
MVQLFETSCTFGFPWTAQVFAVLNKYPNPLAPHVVSIDVISRTILDDGTIRSERLLGLQQDSPKWVNRMLGSEDTTYCREVSFVVPSSLVNPAVSSTEATSTCHLEPPKLLMASTNLTLSHIMQCRESISYLPLPWPHVPEKTVAQLAPSLLSSSTPRPSTSSSPSYPTSRHPLSHPSLPPSTLFSQSALIFTTGKLAAEPYPPIGISAHSPIKPRSFPSASTFPQRAAGKKIEQWAQGRFEMNADGGRGAMEWAAKKFWQQEWDNVSAASAGASY